MKGPHDTHTPTSHPPEEVADPAVFLESRGADRDPDRKPRPLRSLKGAAAARVVRALCAIEPPFGVRTLAESSTTPLGTVSRVVSLLEIGDPSGEVGPG